MIRAFLFSYCINPFVIDFEKTSELTTLDYLKVQSELRSKDIADLLDPLYDEIESPCIHWDSFYFRCSRGLRQNLVPPDLSKKPMRQLRKLGEGGDRCIVCFGSFDGKYPSLVESMPEALENTGFNGYIYYRIGGFPNPTGKEIAYAGVPYCFKIFLMMEAEKLGFTNVLWIDASLLPIDDISPLFEVLETRGALFWEHTHDDRYHTSFPQNHQRLKELTGVDLYESPLIRGGVFGFKTDSPLWNRFLLKYSSMVEEGWPFLSCFPEELVFAAILYQEEFKALRGGVLMDYYFKWDLFESEFGKQFQHKPWLLARYDRIPEPGEPPCAFFYYRSH